MGMVSPCSAKVQVGAFRNRKAFTKGNNQADLGQSHLKFLLKNEEKKRGKIIDDGLSNITQITCITSMMIGEVHRSGTSY